MGENGLGIFEAREWMLVQGPYRVVEGIRGESWGEEGGGRE